MRELPAKEKTMSEKQTDLAANSLTPPLGSPVIVAWVKEQYELYRYWCEAGPGGTGWACQTGGRESRAQYVEIRDWLFSCMVAEGCTCGIRWSSKYCPHCGKLANDKDHRHERSATK
jgi:hypothetical protein